jgi:hypothetical protein
MTTTEGKPHWTMPGRLRRAHQSGGSVAAVLRAERACGKVWLIRHLLEAFDFEIDLAVAAAVVEALSDHHDHQIDAQFETALPDKFKITSQP